MIEARFDDLVLARIAARGRALPVSDLLRATRRIVPDSIDDATLESALRGSLDRLRASKALDSEGLPRDPKAVTAQWGGASAFGWARVVDRFVPGLVLGVATDDARGHRRLEGRDAWATAIVGRSLGLWREGAPPSPAELCDALVWRRIGLPGRPKRVPPELRAHFVALEFGTAPMPADRALRIQAASRVGAKRADLRALREALAHHWLDGRTLGAEAAARSDALDPKKIAARVHAVAARLGARKLLIRDVVQELRRDDELAPVPRPSIDASLIEAHRKGLLILSRADLVATIDPEALRESEIAHHDARYHFVEQETP